MHRQNVYRKMVSNVKRNIVCVVRLYDRNSHVIVEWIESLAHMWKLQFVDQLFFVIKPKGIGSFVVYLQIIRIINIEIFYYISDWFFPDFIEQNKKR